MSLFWEQLLDLIEEGRVVPVVGQDLLVGPNGESLLQDVADRLAEYLEMPPGGGINDVACRYLTQNPDLPVQRIYLGLKRVCTSLDSLPPPEPLLKLAAIPEFQLFVSTTFDSGLARAIDQVRFAGQRRTRVLSYAPDRREDLDLAQIGDGVPTVFQLLGKLSVTPSYAATQWDLVEYFHALQSETRRPKILFDELNRQTMLVMGSSFGGWLARFFLRMAKGHLASGARTADYIADQQVSGDPNLVLFVRHFSRSIEIYDQGNTVDFVNELHGRWQQRHPAGARPELAPAIPDMAAGSVFLSYAKEDQEAVSRIKEALEAAGVDVFFDKSRLRAGDAWEPKLRRCVRECSLFVPVISRNSLTAERRYFRMEWNLALEEAQRASFADEESFLLPVVLDDTSPGEAAIPERFRAYQWQPLPGGVPAPAFVSRVQQLYRRYQKSVATGRN